MHAPAILLVSFVPMLLTALAYKYLNRADPDCGTSFAWTTRAFGPWVGWLNGWAIFVADVLVMASLSVIASQYTYLLFGWQSAANSTTGLVVGAVVWIALMTWICYRGIELSARIQLFLLGAEVAILARVRRSSLWSRCTRTIPWLPPCRRRHGSTRSTSSLSALADGVLLGIFIYWGWDSGVAVNEEPEIRPRARGGGGRSRPILLVLIYLVVSVAAQAYGGTYPCS